MGRQPERRRLQDAVKRIASDRLTVTTQAGMRGLAIKGDPFLGDLKFVCDGTDTRCLEGSSPCAHDVGAKPVLK